VKRSHWFVLVALVALLSVGGGFVGQKVEEALEGGYHQGTAFLDGVGVKTAIGSAVFEDAVGGAFMKVQLQGALEVAEQTLDVSIASAPGAVAASVGALQIDALGKGAVTIKANGAGFPAIKGGSIITLTTARTAGSLTVREVARGTFGVP
jgi:hypothetical protein